jgi:hypothetical protein
MKFEIDFNRIVDDKFLEELGAVLVDIEHVKMPPFEKYVIELNSFEELRELLKKVEKYKGDYYSAIVNFDPHQIFLDSNI